ncbi:MAG: ATP-binding protein [Kiritimatiellae bacterium]|nr:ATP-binding protein [Kiritimatiellia bacterium]MDD5521801.1 ATP-binding protein [Kiritimatiellia bacterium]
MLEKLAAQFPAVIFIGPRQCGKTTLAKTALKARYFDFELNSDRQVFDADPELAIRRIPGPIVFDEAQTMPHLFPALRALIDEERKENGRYYLLGSVNPALIRDISESLAGRVGILELTPFLYRELMGREVNTHDILWLRGGYPDAYLAKDPETWESWCDNYIRTFIERDVGRNGLAFSAQEMRKLMTMIAHSHGGVLNASDFARSLGVSYHTVNKSLDVIEGHFLIRRLQPYYANIGKRLVKAPKLYIRDSGLLHLLLGIRDNDDLITSPARGRSWEGFMVEQVIALEQSIRRGSQFYFYRTHTGTEIDLLIDRGQKRVGYEFKCSSSVSGDDAAGLRQGIADGIIHEGVVVYPGKRSFQIGEAIFAVSAEEMLAKSSTMSTSAGSGMNTGTITEPITGVSE